MENDILDSLNDLGYEGPMTDETAFSKALEGGAKSLEFTKLVHILADELKNLCKLEEMVNMMNSPDDSSSFLLELSSFLKELGCPYKKLVTGHMSSRLQTKEDCILLLDYLISELMAARMVKVDRPKEPTSTTMDIVVARVTPQAGASSANPLAQRRYITYAIEAKNTSEIEAKKTSEIEAKKTSEIEVKNMSEIPAKKMSEIEENKISEIEAKKMSEIEDKKMSEIEDKKMSEIEANNTSEAPKDGSELPQRVKTVRQQKKNKRDKLKRRLMELEMSILTAFDQEESKESTVELQIYDSTTVTTETQPDPTELMDHSTAEPCGKEKATVKRALNEICHEDPKRPKLDQLHGPKQKLKVSILQIKDKEYMIAITSPEKITFIQSVDIINFLEEKTVDLAMRNDKTCVPPTFTDPPKFNNGLLQLFCQNKATVNWVTRTLATFNPLEPKVTPKMVRCGITVPKVIEDVARIGKLLTYYNQWAEIDRWVLHQTSVQKGKATFLVASVPEDIIPAILERQLKLNCLLSFATVKFQNERGRYSSLTPVSEVNEGRPIQWIIHKANTSSDEKKIPSLMDLDLTMDSYTKESTLPCNAGNINSSNDKEKTLSTSVDNTKISYIQKYHKAAIQQESPTARDLKEILIALKFNKPPPNITPEMLFSKLEAKLKDTIQKEGEKLVGKPLYNKAVSEKEWKQIEQTFTEMFEEYRLRRETLITRLECTIQSFEWSERLKNKKDLIQSTYRPKREQLKIKPDVKLSDFLAARTSLLTVEKTSSANVRKNTQSEVNKVMIGQVPDRGGRPNEQQPPPPEMPSWQQRTAGPQGGGRGGFGGRGGGGGGRGGGPGGRGGGAGGRGGRVQGGYSQATGDVGRPQTSPAATNNHRNYQTYEVPPGGYQNQGSYGNQGGYNQSSGNQGGYNQNSSNQTSYNQSSGYQGGYDRNQSGYQSGYNRQDSNSQSSYQGYDSGNFNQGYNQGGGYNKGYQNQGYQNQRGGYQNEHDDRTRGRGGYRGRR